MTLEKMQNLLSKTDK